MKLRESIFNCKHDRLAQPVAKHTRNMAKRFRESGSSVHDVFHSVGEPDSSAV